MLKKELKIMLTAVMFYTRIPILKSVGYSPEGLNKATRYLPFIGSLVGGLGALVFFGLHEVLSKDVAILFSFAAMVLLTGAFHEDAFSDFCDGFGGGYTPEKILSIMKDSRIGTYGAVGLIFLLLSKLVLLRNMEASQIPFILIAAHASSRLMPVLMIFTSRYVSDPDKSKSKPIGLRHSAFTLWFAILSGLALLLLLPYTVSIAVVVAQLLVFAYFRHYVHKKINGYTGDVLGALQQLTEVSAYFVYLLISEVCLPCI